jgi:hypothetical protein
MDATTGGRVPTRIDDALLSQLRHGGDPEADAVAERYLLDHADHHRGGPGGLFRDARAAGASESANDPAVAEWLADRPELPAWADRDRMRRGAHFYNAHGIPMGLGLFLASLPLAYASHDGVQALALTAKLEKNARRRILETAQFVIDVTRSNAMEPGGSGYETTRRVRLVHAGVRQLIEGHPEADWDPAWGVPVNQEHLVGTMISFTIPVLRVLEKLHINYDRSAAEDYCHLWSVVAWVLGIDPELLPMDRTELERVEQLILARNVEPSEGGTRLTGALIETVRSFMTMPLLKRPWPGSTGLPVAAMRMFIGEEIPDLLGVPKANWTRHVLRALRPPKRRVSLGLARIKLLRTVVRRVTRKLFKGFVYATRDGGRPAFNIPTELGFAPRSDLRHGSDRRTNGPVRP